MTLAVFIVCCLLVTLPSYSQLIVNEIQPAPASGEPEWVELYNPASTPYIWSGYIHDASKTVVKIAPISLAAKSFLLITRDSLALREERNIPHSVQILEVKLPSLNNSTDYVVIRNADSVSLDSAFYSLKLGKKGISFERVDPNIPSIAFNNFLVSTASDSSTPGQHNSRTKLNQDAAVISLTQLKNPQRLIAEIQNIGKNNIDDIRCEVWIDDNDNTIRDASEKYAFLEQAVFFPDSILKLEIAIPDYYTEQFARKILFARCAAYFESDERQSNNMKSRILYAPINQGAVSINEIYYDPGDGKSEFVELTNTTSDTISMHGWKLHDIPASDTIVMMENRKIYPRSYVAVIWDSSFFSVFPHLKHSIDVYYSPTKVTLNNTGDIIVLRDSEGEIVDSIIYSPDYHNISAADAKGRSLERISSNLSPIAKTSWRTCAHQNRATPGEENSVSIEIPANAMLSANPNPFSPFSPHNEQCLISFTAANINSRARIVIYDEFGIQRKVLLDLPIVGADNAAVWDGIDDEGRLLPVGKYIAVLEMASLDDNSTDIKKILIVIGK